MKTKTLPFILGVLVTFLLLVGIRFLNYKQSEHIHYHANFAIFIDGKRFDLTNDKFMEEVSACTVDTSMTPKERVHLHNHDQDAVHVHDHAVTWGNLMMNLNLNIGDDYIIDDKGNLYKNNDQKTLRFILNGQVVTSIYNREIKSEDRVLINYGSESESDLIKDRFPQVSSSAHQLNMENDPASCGSNSNQPSFIDKLKNSIL